MVNVNNLRIRKTMPSNVLATATSTHHRSRENEQNYSVESIVQLVRDIQTRRSLALPADWVRREIVAQYFFESATNGVVLDAADNGFRVSLVDPISRERIHLPARSVNCRLFPHCFDLFHFLKFNLMMEANDEVGRMHGKIAEKNRWRCPVQNCHAVAEQSHLRLDGYFEEILAKIGPEPLEVELLPPDGAWRPLEQLDIKLVPIGEGDDIVQIVSTRKRACVEDDNNKNLLPSSNSSLTASINVPSNHNGNLSLGGNAISFADLSTLLGSLISEGDCPLEAIRALKQRLETAEAENRKLLHERDETEAIIKEYIGRMNEKIFIPFDTTGRAEPQSPPFPPVATKNPMIIVISDDDQQYEDDFESDDDELYKEEESESKKETSKESTKNKLVATKINEKGKIKNAVETLNRAEEQRKSPVKSSIGLAAIKIPLLVTVSTQAEGSTLRKGASSPSQQKTKKKKSYPQQKMVMMASRKTIHKKLKNKKTKREVKSLQSDKGNVRIDDSEDDEKAVLAKNNDNSVDIVVAEFHGFVMILDVDVPKFNNYIKRKIIHGVSECPMYRSFVNERRRLETISAQLSGILPSTKDSKNRLEEELKAGTEKLVELAETLALTVDLDKAKESMFKYIKQRCWLRDVRKSITLLWNNFRFAFEKGQVTTRAEMITAFNEFCGLVRQNYVGEVDDEEKDAELEAMLDASIHWEWSDHYKIQDDTSGQLPISASSDEGDV